MLPESSGRTPCGPASTPGPDIGEAIFQAILDHPEGLWIGKVDPRKT